MSRVSTQYIVRMSAYENKPLVYSSRRKYERVKEKRGRWREKGRQRRPESHDFDDPTNSEPGTD